MTGFVAKTINDQTLGDALRERRAALGLSLEEVERVTHISKKYIVALETNDLCKLPDLVYARNFVRALAKNYGLDAEAFAKSLIEELAVATGAPMRHPINFVEGRSLVVTPRLIKVGILAVCFLGIFGYFALSVRGILTPPNLLVTSPKDDQAFKSRQVLLEGRSEPEVELTVNGELVPVEADGSFKDMLDLPAGVANLRVAAKKKHSKESEVFLKIVIEEPAPVENASSTVTVSE